MIGVWNETDWLAPMGERWICLQNDRPLLEKKKNRIGGDYP